MIQQPDQSLPPRAVIFDLAGTLVEWPRETPDQRLADSYEYLPQTMPNSRPPSKDAYVKAMTEAEAGHWKRVVETEGSGAPREVVLEGFRRLDLSPSDAELDAVLEAYGKAIEGWTVVCPDAVETLGILRERGYRLGLISNTWWVSEWHDLELATHGLAVLLDEVMYTLRTQHSKRHPSVFTDMAGRLRAVPGECVMVGDRMTDDVWGAIRAGMRGVWKRNHRGYPRPEKVDPSAVIEHLAELPALLRSWGGT